MKGQNIVLYNLMFLHFVGHLNALKGFLNKKHIYLFGVFK